MSTPVVLLLVVFFAGTASSANIIKDPKPCDVSPTTANEILHKPCKEGLEKQVNVDPEGHELQHVIILNRHSIRAPARVDNVLLTESSFPLGLGYSTTVGNKFSVKVGKIWRKFYENFLEDISVRSVWARSSSYVRCYETLQLILSVMFPPEGQYDFGYPIQPIPIIRVPIGNDVNVENCGAKPPSELKELNELTDPALTKDGFANFGEFVQWVTEKTNFQANETEYYEPVIDGLYCQRYNQLPIPKWAEDKWSSMDFAMRILSYEYWINDIPYYGNYMGKFLADRLLGHASGKYPEKFSFLTYHDTSIQAVVKAMGNSPTELYPSFLGALHFQIYKRESDGELVVRLMFHQGATKELEYRQAKEVVLANCPFPNCTLKELAGKLSTIYDDVDRSNCPPIDLSALL